MIWTWTLEKDNHSWAFYYYLKRMGDEPMLHVYGDKIRISIEKREEMKNG